MKKTDHILLTGTIELVSGMRVGGSDDVLQIGGTDLTCIKDPATNKPYVPGSSIKGRMRSCLEKHLGRVSGREPCTCGSDDCPICRVFGPHKNTRHALGPTRLIVRDAHLIGDGFVIENKTESTTRRDTGAAEHPRTVERVAPGAKFALEVAVQVFDLDRDFLYEDLQGQRVTGADALLEIVDHALFLVEQTGLGAGVGKGYGQIKLIDVQEFRPKRRSVRQRVASPEATPEPTS